MVHRGAGADVLSWVHVNGVWERRTTQRQKNSENERHIIRG